MDPGTLYSQLLDAPVAADVRSEDGSVRPLPVRRWLGATSSADEEVAAAVDGPVLDVGCGPGRLLDALAGRGVWALGVDLSPAAVAVARRRGRRAVLGCIFDEVPRAGRWGSALLLDGNVGIGGDPVLLLSRIAALLRPGGRVVAEVEPPGAVTVGGRVRIETVQETSAWFPWARVGADGIGALAATSGLAVDRLVEVDGRWFAWLA